MCERSDDSDLVRSDAVIVTEVGLCMRSPVRGWWGGGERTAPGMGEHQPLPRGWQILSTQPTMGGARGINVTNGTTDEREFFDS